MVDTPFAVYMEIGPGSREAARAADVLDSVAAYSPSLRWVVLVDDDTASRDLAAICRVPAACELTVLRNPRHGAGDGRFGGMCVATLAGLEAAQRTAAAFVLKLDTDSLVIAPFAAAVSRVLDVRPDAGLLGVIGDSFGENRTYRWTETNRWTLERVLTLPATVPELRACGMAPSWLRECTDPQYEAFLVARATLERAVDRGYALGEYCQGGGYVVSRPLLDALAANGAYARQMAWRDLAVAEDLMIAMQCAAAGYRMYDVSDEGPRFAIDWRCPPLSRAALVREGYSVIHSIRGSLEDEFRAFFRDRRRGWPSPAAEAREEPRHAIHAREA
jgi:hypothetical protein